MEPEGPATIDAVELRFDEPTHVDLTPSEIWSEPRSIDRVGVDGKLFRTPAGRFPFRGVTYGTFMSRGDGALFPERRQVERDFTAMAGAGFTVVRTYTEPPEDVLEAAHDRGLRLFPGVFYPDWRYLVGASRRDRARVVREARETVRRAASRFAGDPRVVAISLGNEIPADVLRWVGTKTVSSAIAELAEVARAVDPELPLTYANYPTAEYLPLPDLDFLTFNVFLEDPNEFRRYLTRLHHLAGSRPLVLGEVGLDAGRGESAQAETLSWQLGEALERGVAGTCVFSWTDEWAVADKPVEGWRFGLTRADRSPRPALEVASEWNGRSIADASDDWPSVSVVICAHNAAATLDECLSHACALDYPEFEIIVVDDGSSDETGDIIRRHPGADLLPIPHSGLSAARNAGLAAAAGDLIAYLDSDAYPPPEWLYYLVLGLDGPNVGAAGGPNFPPEDEPPSAQAVARAPGGPVHVMLTDHRAEHVPGCNLAVWREVLEDLGGFNPVYTAAGDDVDVCWRLLARGYEIGFHPAAFVWHRRRPGLRPYLRQQRGYGHAEALLQVRNPERFNSVGTARWQGRIYGDSLVPVLGRQRVYRGEYGAAAYQSVYRGGGHAIDVAHQVGLPLALAALLTAPLAMVAWPLALPAIAGLVTVVVLAALDVAAARPPHRMRSGRLSFRLSVAGMHMLQPILRLWGRVRRGRAARRDLPPNGGLPGPIRQVAGGALLLPLDRPREKMAADIVAVLRRAGFRAIDGTGWEDYDALFPTSALVAGKLVTSGFPEGSVQMTIRARPLPLRTAAAVAATVAVAAIAPMAGAIAGALVLLDVGRGLWRAGPGARRVLSSAAG
jgi:glycosyltransferase involved in cell wall biosynthesis